MSARIASVHGSAPKMPILSDDARGSSPCRTNSSAMFSMYDGVTMMRSGCEVDDELHLLFGVSAGHRHHGAAESLGAVVRAKPAGEEPVAVGHVHDIAGESAGGADRARHHVGPGVDVARRVADDRRLAGGAARGVHAHDLIARHGEQAEGVAVAEILLGREGEARQVVDGAEVVGMNARGRHFPRYGATWS